jgi:hypothetical protein
MFKLLFFAIFLNDGIGQEIRQEDSSASDFPELLEEVIHSQSGKML